MGRLSALLICFCVCVCWADAATAADGASQATPDYKPKYKPSSRAPAPLDITTNAYGYSRTAPDALEIGSPAPHFVLPRAGGGEVILADKLAAGPVVLIFYRGHW